MVETLPDWKSATSTAATDRALLPGTVWAKSTALVSDDGTGTDSAPLAEEIPKSKELTPNPAAKSDAIDSEMTAPRRLPTRTLILTASQLPLCPS